MITEKIKELVNNSEFPQLQKNVMNGFIDRAKKAKEKEQEDRDLIEKTGVRKLAEVILSTDEVKIYTVNGKDEWDLKYPYRSIYLTSKGTWARSCAVSPTLDVAFLIYLQHKHLGLNSQFADFSIKMLGIKLPSE
jgi:hypothetical protein